MPNWSKDGYQRAGKAIRRIEKTPFSGVENGRGPRNIQVNRLAVTSSSVTGATVTSGVMTAGQGTAVLQSSSVNPSTGVCTASSTGIEVTVYNSNSGTIPSDAWVHVKVIDSLFYVDNVDCPA